MTNKEKYKQAFSALQPSNEIRLEEKIMKEYKRKQSKRIIAMAAILCLAVFAGGGGAYAANVGGIQRTIQLWIHGDQTTAELNVNDDGSYTVKIPDENGETQTMGGGGVAFDAFGNERALTEEEILDHLDSPNIEYYDDGSIWLFYRDMPRTSPMISTMTACATLRSAMTTVNSTSQPRNTVAGIFLQTNLPAPGNLTTTTATQQASPTSQPARSQTPRVGNNYQRSLNKITARRSCLCVTRRAVIIYCSFSSLASCSSIG